MKWSIWGFSGTLISKMSVSSWYDTRKSRDRPLNPFTPQFKPPDKDGSAIFGFSDRSGLSVSDYIRNRCMLSWNMHWLATMMGYVTFYIATFFKKNNFGFENLKKKIFQTLGPSWNLWEGAHTPSHTWGYPSMCLLSHINAILSWPLPLGHGGSFTEASRK